MSTTPARSCRDFASVWFLGSAAQACGWFWLGKANSVSFWLRRDSNADWNEPLLLSLTAAKGSIYIPPRGIRPTAYRVGKTQLRVVGIRDFWGETARLRAAPNSDLTLSERGEK